MGRLGVVAIALLAAARVASAEVEPSFDLETCVRDATHIVVATEGDRIDGELRVVESWKGDIEPGTQLSLPELAAFEEESARAIFPGLSAPSPARVEHVSGRRMAIFLCRTGSGLVSANPASEDARFATVWLEPAGGFVFVQVLNPGAPVLVRKFAGEDELREMIARFRDGWVSLAAARGLAEPSERVQALSPLVRLGSKAIAADALDAIADAGAAPVLRDLLKDEGLGATRADVARALARAQGVAAVPDLALFLEAELAFWKASGPGLARNWAVTTDLWERRVGPALAAIHLLGALRQPANVLARFREIWKSTPTLASLPPVPAACDDATIWIHSVDAPERIERLGWAHAKLPKRRTYASVPVTTAEDEKRVAELEAALARDLAAEPTGPGKRPVLRGEPSAGDVRSELALAIEKANVPLDVKGLDIELGSYVRVLGQWRRGGSLEDLGEVRARSAENVRVAAGLLAAERVAPPPSVEKHWRDLLAIRGPSQGAWAIERAFVLDAIDALGVRPSCSLCGAELALDLWRFQHDLRRDERPDGDGRPAELLVAALPGLDEAWLEKVEGELNVLEGSTPSFAAEVRRRRLALGCFFRAYHKGEIPPARSDSLEHARPTPLDHLAARARLSDRRVGSIRREWEKLDALFRGYEQSLLSKLEVPVADPTGPWVDYLIRGSTLFRGDVSRIRLVRLFVACIKFHRANGRWPRDAGEVGGRGELDVRPSGALHAEVEGQDFELLPPRR